MNAKEGIHVIFGTGPLGKAVMKELLSSGKKVKMVNRSGKADVPNNVVVAKGDATDTESVRQICKDAYAIYNCAKPPYNEWPEKFPQLLEGLILGAQSSGAILVHADNLYMYGPTDKVLTEELPYKAVGKKGIVRADMSRRLLELHKKGNIRMTIARASDFYGPNVVESSMGMGIFRSAMEGKPASVLGNIDQPHTYTYIDDFAKALVILAESEKSLGEAWHVPSAKTITTRQLISMIFQETKQSPKFRVASKRMVSFFGLFSSSMRELKEMVYLYDSPFVVDHSKFAKTFGDHSTPHIEAVKQTLKSLG